MTWLERLALIACVATALFVVAALGAVIYAAGYDNGAAAADRACYCGRP